MRNRLILIICFGIIALFVASCSYASNETDFLNNTISTDNITVLSVDLKSDNNDKINIDSDIDNISIDYGERIDIDWDCEALSGDFNEHCNCHVYIDGKLVNFISDLYDVNMYYYNFQDSNFLNSIYPDVGLHNFSVIFEFDTPQKYDVSLESYKKYDDTIYKVLFFKFNVNENSEAKKRYSYNTTLNILNKDKTVHIRNISLLTTYKNPLFYKVIVDNPDNSFFIIISNTDGIIHYDYGSGRNNDFDFQDLKNKIKPGVYNLTVVNDFDNTFDTASFTLFNDIIINTTYKIENNDVIIDVKLWSEYTTPIQFNMYKINGTVYEQYRSITKEISVNDNNHNFNLKIRFNNVDNENYDVVILDYYNIIDDINFTVNYTFINETKINEDIININKTVKISDNVENNLSDDNRSNTGGNANSINNTNYNSDLKENTSDSNSQKSNVYDDFKKVISGLGDLANNVNSISNENVNSYEIIKNSASKSLDMFSNMGILILLLIAFIVGFLRLKHEY